MHRFRKLTVYQRSLGFTRETRKLTRTFPKEELYGLTSQFRRAADSIVLNVAEGAGSNSKKEFSHFFAYSIRSGYECIACLDIALTNGYLKPEVHERFDREINEIISMIVGLQRSLSN